MMTRLRSFLASSIILGFAGCGGGNGGDGAAGMPDLARATPPGDLAPAVPDGAVPPDLAVDPDLGSPPVDSGGGSPDLVVADLASPADSGSALHLLDDEFNSAATLAHWIDLYPMRHDILDINTTMPGSLTVVPRAQLYNHWYSDSAGPLLYKTVTGNFVVEIAVDVGRRTDMTLAPRGQFNAAGIVLRDPASTLPGGQKWVMYNLGFQTTAVAREIKTTRPAMGMSLSTLYLNDTAMGGHAGRLRACRLGATFHFFFRAPNDPAWTEEGYSMATHVGGNGMGQPTPGTTLGGPIRFDRPDLAQTLQVGLFAGNWDAPLEVRGDFDYVHFREAQKLADCTADF